MVYGDANHIDEKDAFIEKYLTEPWNWERLLDNCFISQPAAFFRRAVVDRYGLIDQEAAPSIDYEYWVRLGKNGVRFEYLPKLLAATRLHDEAFTVGSRIACHAANEHILCGKHIGWTPDRWLVQLRASRSWKRRAFGRSDPFRFAMAVSLVSWYASLRWNHSLSDEPITNDGQLDQRQCGQSDSGESRLMRIGFDISQTGKAKAGCGWLADSLIRHLAEIDTRNEYVLYPTFGDGYWDIVGPESTVHIDKSNFQRGLSHATMAEMREFWRNPPSDLETRLGEPDIVHANNFFCPRGLRQARLVYTLYDMMFLEHPESTTEANRNTCFTGVFNASLRADFIVAISQYSRNHFLSTFPHYPADRVHVVHRRFLFQPQCPRPRKFQPCFCPGRFWLECEDH